MLVFRVFSGERTCKREASEEHETFANWRRRVQRIELAIIWRKECVGLKTINLRTNSHVLASLSSVLFRQSKLQCKNKLYKNCKSAREPRSNQRAYETWAPQSHKFCFCFQKYWIHRQKKTVQSLLDLAWV